VGYNAIDMMQDHLSRFEERIQRLIEGGFARLFDGRLHPHEVAIQLARAMEDNTRQNDQGQFVAPDVYIVRLSAPDHEALLWAQSELGAALAEELVKLARQNGLTLLAAPTIRLLADRDVPRHQIKVSAYHTDAKFETTKGIRLSEINEQVQSGLQAGLISKDGRHIPLDKPVVTLGRDRANQVILDSPLVSRRHAQIRLRFGRYVLFDLGSTSGTRVNGKPIQEAVLQPGDVIALADTSLIYTEDKDEGEGENEDEFTKPRLSTHDSPDGA
jgi:hypothetical protein